MDTRTRLAELIAATERDSAVKQARTGGRTRIAYAPPGAGWGRVTPRSVVVPHPANSPRVALQRYPQSWSYVYVDRIGGETWGGTLGTTRAGVIRHLLAQRRAFPA